MIHEQATQPCPEEARHSAARRSGRLSGMIKRVNDTNALLVQIDCSAWCSRSCRTSRGLRQSSGSCVVRFHQPFVTVRDKEVRVPILGWFLPGTIRQRTYADHDRRPANGHTVDFGYQRDSGREGLLHRHQRRRREGREDRALAVAHRGQRRPRDPERLDRMLPAVSAPAARPR